MSGGSIKCDLPWTRQRFVSSPIRAIPPGGMALLGLARPVKKCRDECCNHLQSPMAFLVVAQGSYRFGYVDVRMCAIVFL